MTQLTTNFWRSEFACQCDYGCGCTTVDFHLVSILQKLRTHYRRPISVESGHRCAQYNKDVGGSPKSQHLMGKAADIKVDGVSPDQVYELLDLWFPYNCGLGVYDTFTHIDVRDNKARWDHRT